MVPGLVGLQIGALGMGLRRGGCGSFPGNTAHVASLPHLRKSIQRDVPFLGRFIGILPVYPMDIGRELQDRQPRVGDIARTPHGPKPFHPPTPRLASALAEATAALRQQGGVCNHAQRRPTSVAPLRGQYQMRFGSSSKNGQTKWGCDGMTHPRPGAVGGAECPGEPRPDHVNTLAQVRCRPRLIP